MDQAKLDQALVMIDDLSRKILRLDAVFNESDHPRASDGKFGSGAGSSGQYSKLPFVHQLVSQHGSHAKIKEYLADPKIPRETLNKALGFVETRGDPNNSHDVALKKMLVRELDDRASRGA